MNVHITNEAGREFDEAIAWYVGTDPALGARLFQDFDAAVEYIRQYPFLASEVQGAARGFPLAKFPYTIWYIVEHDTIYVHAFAHHKRQWFYWLNRLG